MQQASSTMRAYLPICILFIGQCCLSSASFLTPIKFFEEPSIADSLAASPIGSPLMPLDTSITPLSLLTGYLVYTFYKDSSCTYQTAVLHNALNVCFHTALGQYEYITATVSSVTRKKFSDSLCTVPVPESPRTLNFFNCIDKRTISISSVTTANPSVATAYYRCKNVSTTVYPHYIRSFSDLNCAI